MGKMGVVYLLTASTHSKFLTTAINCLELT